MLLHQEVWKARGLLVRGLSETLRGSGAEAAEDMDADYEHPLG